MTDERHIDPPHIMFNVLLPIK